MADPGQEYNKIVVTSAKGRSLFSLCPSRAPRVVADEDSTLTHFVLRLCAIGDIEDFLKDPASLPAVLFCKQPDGHKASYSLCLALRLGASFKELPVQGAWGKAKKLKPSDASALDGAAWCLRLHPGDFEDACRVHTTLLQPLMQLLISAEASQAASSGPAALYETLQACTAILRAHDPKAGSNTVEAVVSRTGAGSPSKIITGRGSPSRCSQPAAAGTPQLSPDQSTLRRNEVASVSAAGTPGGQSPAVVGPPVPSPAVAEAADAVQFNFLQFAKLYHEPLFEAPSDQCLHHLQALIALAGSAAPAVRDRFMKLGVVAMLLREASLELEMLPKATGESVPSPAMSAAYSPIASPHNSSQGGRASSRGDRLSARGEKLSARGDSLLGLKPVAASHSGEKPVLPGDGEQPSSARIGAWPGAAAAEAAAADRPLQVSSTLCSTYAPVGSHQQPLGGAKSPTEGSIATLTPSKADVFSWQLPDLEQEYWDTHRSIMMHGARSKTPSPTRPLLPPDLAQDSATPDMAQALGINPLRASQTLGGFSPIPEGHDSPHVPRDSSPPARHMTHGGTSARSPVPFRGVDMAAEASPAGSHSPSPGRRGVPKLVFATPGGSTFSPITPGGAAAASPASPELGDASDEDEGQHSGSDSSSSCSDDGLPTTTAKQQPSCVPRLQLLTPSLTLPGKGKEASRTSSAGISPVTPSPSIPGSVLKIATTPVQDATLPPHTHAASLKKGEAQLTGRKLDLRRMALETSTARAVSSRQHAETATDLRTPFESPDSPGAGGTSSSSSRIKHGSPDFTYDNGSSSSSPSPSPSPEAISCPQARYRQCRGMRRLYTDTQIHLQGLRLLLKLLVLPGSDDLDPDFCIPGPNNALYPLWRHFSHTANAGIIPLIQYELAGEGSTCRRLFKLLTPALFHKDVYHTWRRIARGASAEIYRCTYLDKRTGQQQDAVIKSIHLPASALDNCTLAEVFAEVALLERFAHCPYVTQLMDYGCNEDNAYLVMRAYAGSLAQWRKRQHPDPGPALKMYLRIFLEVLEAVQALAGHNLVHFDLKCDNVLLAPLPGHSEDSVWLCPAQQPPFQAVLADFGVSRQYASAAAAFTVRSRGTEATKAPEMLMVDRPYAYTSGHMHAHAGIPGPASDIWGLGCLLYELLTGHFLFDDRDFSQFYMRLTRPDQDLLGAEQVQRISHLPGTVPLLQYILARDPRARPSLQAIASRVSSMIEQT